jgi:hypothetical protein
MNILYLAMSTLTADHYVYYDIHQLLRSVRRQSHSIFQSTSTSQSLSCYVNVFGCAGEILYDGAETMYRLEQLC